MFFYNFPVPVRRSRLRGVLKTLQTAHFRGIVLDFVTSEPKILAVTKLKETLTSALPSACARKIKREGSASFSIWFLVLFSVRFLLLLANGSSVPVAVARHMWSRRA